MAGVVPPVLAETAAGGADLLARIRRDLRTASYLAPSQLGARAGFVARRQAYALAPAWPIARARDRVAASGCRPDEVLPGLPDELACPEAGGTIEQRVADVERGLFSFLGSTRDHGAGIDWRDAHVSPLWAFQMHYLGAVLESAVVGRPEVGRRVLDSWRARYESRWDPVAWHPYTVSLRLTNLCLAAGRAGSFAVLGAGAADLAATHAAFLADHLERDLRGNHLLENAVALAFAGRAFAGPAAAGWERTARAVLEVEIPEQVLADGGHFELSPMYHSIVLHRLLQLAALWGPGDALVGRRLIPAVERMSRWLAGVLCPDGDIPLLGDAARGFAPAPDRLLSLARDVVGVAPEPAREGVTAFRDTGLYVLRRGPLWTILDAGPVCPDYLPGHGQADSLTVEVWAGGECVVGDPGVHEYTGALRAWGRSSRAHSTVTIDDADTSEVYGSFRVGARARVTGVRVGEFEVEAEMVPAGGETMFSRRLALEPAAGAVLAIEDRVSGPVEGQARSRLHLAPGLSASGGNRGPGGRTHPGGGAISGGGAPGVLAGVRGATARVGASGPWSLERGVRSSSFGRVDSTEILVQNLERVGQARAGGFRVEVGPAAHAGPGRGQR